MYIPFFLWFTLLAPCVWPSLAQFIFLLDWMMWSWAIFDLGTIHFLIIVIIMRVGKKPNKGTKPKKKHRIENKQFENLLTQVITPILSTGGKSSTPPLIFIPQSPLKTINRLDLQLLKKSIQLTSKSNLSIFSRREEILFAIPWIRNRSLLLSNSPSMRILPKTTWAISIS